MIEVTAFKSNNGKVYATKGEAVEADAELMLYTIAKGVNLDYYVYHMSHDRAFRNKIQTVFDYLGQNVPCIDDDLADELYQMFASTKLYENLLANKATRRRLRNILDAIDINTTIDNKKKGDK